MLEEEVKNKLRGKSKNALLVLAENIGTKGYSKLSKAKLLDKLFGDYENHSKLLAELGIKSRKNIVKKAIKTFFVIVLTALTGVLIKGYFFPSVSKKDVQIIVDTIDKNEQYLAEIEFLEKYKKKFLSNEMPISYKVFGVMDGKIAMKEELVNNSLKSDYTSKISLDFKKRLVDVSILANELELGPPDKFDKFSFYDMTLSQTFPLKEDTPYNFKIAVVQGYVFRFVLLKEDREQPIFAIGVGKD